MREGARFRLVGLIEWLVAAGCVIAALAAGAVLSREFRSVRAVVPVLAGPADKRIVPAGLRPGSVATPELVLPDGKVLTVGAAASTLGILGPRAEDGPPSFERTERGQRESRTYRYAGMEFVVVTMNDRIVAIFR